MGSYYQHSRCMGKIAVLEERRQELLEQEQGNPEKDFWLSYVDPAKPEGSASLGVIIVTAPGFMSAIQKTHMLGISPGGEVQGVELPDEHEFDLTEYRDKLLSKEELLKAGFIDE